jgi:hypothetical protein
MVWASLPVGLCTRELLDGEMLKFGAYVGEPERGEYAPEQALQSPYECESCESKHAPTRRKCTQLPASVVIILGGHTAYSNDRLCDDVY